MNPPRGYYVTSSFKQDMQRRMNQTDIIGYFLYFSSPVMKRTLKAISLSAHIAPYETVSRLHQATSGAWHVTSITLSLDRVVPQRKVHNKCRKLNTNGPTVYSRILTHSHDEWHAQIGHPSTLLIN